MSRKKLIGQAGLPWINLFIAGCALFVSAASFYVAARESRSLEQMLKADTWPYLALETGNTFDGVKQIRMIVKNSGVGPARLESFEIWHEDKPVRNASELLRVCCGIDELNLRNEDDFIQKVGPLITEKINGVLIPAREQISFLEIAERSANPRIYSALDRARTNLKGRACYCSVLDQ